MDSLEGSLRRPTSRSALDCRAKADSLETVPGSLGLTRFELPRLRITVNGNRIAPHRRRFQPDGHSHWGGIFRSSRPFYANTRSLAGRCHFPHGRPDRSYLVVESTVQAQPLALPSFCVARKAACLFEPSREVRNLSPILSARRFCRALGTHRQSIDGCPNVQSLDDVNHILGNIRSVECAPGSSPQGSIERGKHEARIAHHVR